MIQLVGLTILLLVVAFTSRFLWRHYSTPQMATFRQLRSGMVSVQHYALGHIGEISVPIGPPGPVGEGGRFNIGDVASFVYSVDEEQGMFVHLFSGKLHRWRPKEWLIVCMLTSMLEFERQLAGAGISIEKGMKQLVPAPTGTIFVQYVFTPEQHRKFAASLSAQPLASPSELKRLKIPTPC